MSLEYPQLDLDVKVLAKKWADSASYWYHQTFAVPELPPYQIGELSNHYNPAFDDPCIDYSRPVVPHGEPSASLSVHIPESASTSEKRPDKWVGLRLSKQALEKTQNPDGKEWRSVGCHWRRIADHVTIRHAVEHKSAAFGNVRICGSVWTCPVCAARISELRRDEIGRAMDQHFATGGAAYMITFTFPHYAKQTLALILNQFLEALRKLRAGRVAKLLRESIGFVGLIRALEVTYGDRNGWHPHVHEAWLTEKPLDADQLYRLHCDLFKLWESACRRAGLPSPSADFGLSIERAFSPQEYISKFGTETKWGSSRELTKGHTKQGRQDRFSAFDLLYAGREKEFQEFASAFYGKAQIFWSRGLKKRFAIEEVTDEEAAETSDDHAVIFKHLDKSLWHAIRSHKQEIRGEILKKSLESLPALTSFLSNRGLSTELDGLFLRLVKVSPAHLSLDTLSPREGLRTVSSPCVPPPPF